MFDSEKEIKRYGLSSREEFESLINDCIDKIDKQSDLEWDDIVNKYGLNVHYDTLRKSCQFLTGGVFVAKYFMDRLESELMDLSKKHKVSSESSEGNKMKFDDDEYIRKLRDERQKIQKEKRKLFDERLDINKKIRESARLETTIEKLEDALKQMSREIYVGHAVQPAESTDKNTADIVCLSDLHIGAAFKSDAGEYNSHIASKFLNQYLSKVLKLKNASTCHIVLLGDIISGSIHKTISVTNKENVVDQVMVASRMIADFIYAIGKEYENVYVHSVPGNHSRIEAKEDALNSERLDRLIPWFAEALLNQCSNIVFDSDQSSNTLTSFDICGRKYVAVHGDYDQMSESSIARLCSWYGEIPYCIICAHKHYPSMTDILGVTIVQSGCLSGSGCEFTEQKRLRGRPSQTMLHVDKDGIVGHYPVRFSIS